MKLFAFLLSYFLCYQCLPLQAQRSISRQRIDSLRFLLKSAKTDNSAKLLFDLSTAYLDIDQDSSLQLLHQAKSIYVTSKNDTALLSLYVSYAEKLRSKDNTDASYGFLLQGKKLIETKALPQKYNLLLNSRLADYHSDRGNHDSALWYGREQLRYARDTTEVIIALKRVGLTYNSIGLTVKALDSYLQALRLLSKINNPKQEAGVYNNLGVLYEDDGDNDKAEECYKKAYELFRQSSDPQGEFRLLNNLGILYDHQHRYEESLKTLAQAEALLPTLKNKLREAIIELNFANTLTHMGRASEAIPRFQKAKVLFKALNDNYGVTLSDRQLAEAYYRVGRYKEGEQYALVCIKSATASGYTYLIKDAYHDLFDIYEATRQFEKAFKYQSLYRNMEDSINDKNRRSKLGLLEKEYELSRAETDKQTLEKENELQKAQATVDKITRIGMGSGLGVFFLVAAMAGIAYYRTRSKNILLATQKAKIEEANALITRQAEQLQEAAKTKARFFANVSHELRTPVTLLNGMLELMHDDQGGKQVEGKMGIALANSRRLQNLVDEVLDLSRLEIKQPTLQKKNKELVPLLNRIVFAFESLLVKKNIKLEYKADELNGVSLMVDEEKFEKILNNLIYNAVKFNREAGWIKVETKLAAAKDEVIIAISDSGIGIPERDLPFIFERFYQSSATDNKNPQGIGIGLSLVKEFMTLHEGRVSVSSRLHEGSTFTLYFPMTANITSEKIETDILETEQEVLIDFSEFENRKSILVVEDNEEMRFYLKEIFENNVDIIEAGHGREGLQWLKTHTPDLIISDVMMPEMDGYEFLSQLKNNAILKNIPVIMLTARASEEDLLHGLSLGIDDYIIKPFNAKELKIRVHNLLLNQAVRKKWYAQPVGKDEVHDENTEDNGFLKKVQEFVETRAQNALLGISDLADHVAMSERQLYRKCGMITGMTPAQLVKEIRLKLAYKILMDHQVSKVTDLASRVGFDNSAYFSKQFFGRFGKKPVDLL
jgi:signal transduction histidine kinase/DNA-binding response OmpR family regulator/Flp pilus assembly protein TadD